jgi:hypothetical protein
MPPLNQEALAYLSPALPLTADRLETDNFIINNSTPFLPESPGDGQAKSRYHSLTTTIACVKLKLAVLNSGIKDNYNRGR